MSGAVDGFLRDRSALIGAAEPGTHAARTLSDLTDKAVSTLAEAALSRLRSPWAVLALGGWGARRLLPLSDLDLLVVTDASASELRPALVEVLYPLWDAGLKVGHQVRSRRDHLRMTAADTETLTATLTGRVLCGDRSLGERVLAEVATAARKRARIHLKDLHGRLRPGSPYLLEPDLKEGAGGQRDIDELVWTGAVLEGATAADPSPLVSRGLLDATELARLRVACDTITAARWEVHRQSPRASSVYSLEIAGESVLDGEVLQASLADAHHILLRVRDRCGGCRADDTPLDASALFTALDRGEDALPALEEAAWAGLLDDLVPAFGELMHVRRPALSHIHTVGAHSLRCAVLAASCTGLPEAAPAHVDDRNVLQVAALLHDVGKAQRGPGHAERGMSAVRTLGSRFGLSSAAVEDAAALVREHLLLAETASGKDIHDEDVVLRVAARIGRRRLVDGLHVLTIADSLATGPGAWTAWHAALVGELADRLRSTLSDAVEGTGIVDQADAVRSAASAILESRRADPAAVRFTHEAPIRYLAATGTDDVVTHAHLVAEVAASGGRVFTISVSTGPAEGSWRVSLAAGDRPGLFAAACGALSLAGLDILAADAYEAGRGTALDVFVVTPDTRAMADTATWSAFERHLDAALRDPSGLATRLMERRRHYPPRSRMKTRIETGETGAYATVIKVRAADRVGLLYDLACALGELGLRIKWARAITRDGVATDVFHITDESGEPVDDPGLLGHVSMRIRERV